MDPHLPTVGVLKKAINVYLAEAYAGGEAPPTVKSRIAALDTAPPDAPAPIETFECPPSQGKPVLFLRLGQSKYPNMKLAIEWTPDGAGYLFRADAHDKHLHAPPGSPDAAWLADLRCSNQATVERIEAAWMAAGLPTFRDYLRRELARKREERAAH